MAENEHFNQQSRQQFQQQAAEKERLQKEEPGRRCKSCGTDLEDEALFCPHCGEQFGGEERACPFCGKKTTHEICPQCNKRVIPINCPKCGTPSLFDACENCGTLLNQELAAFFTEEKPQPQVMTEEEARKIEEEFKQQPESPEFQQFQKRLIERQIHLKERDYLKKMEKRIIQVFGSQPFSLELPDPEEEAFRMKAYSALEKTVIERQEKLLQEEWERLFPEEKKVEVNQNGIIILKKQAEIDEENRRAELERKREAMENRYRELLSQVENEVEAHRIAEEKRKEEERLRREEEERRKREEAERLERERQKERERQRLEREMFKNRLRGYWYHSSHNGMLKIEIHIDSKTTAHCIYTCTHCGGSRIQYAVNFDGVNMKLSSVVRTGSHCTFSEYSYMDYFSGTINNSGTVMNGYLSNGCNLTFNKR